MALGLTITLASAVSRLFDGLRERLSRRFRNAVRSEAGGDPVAPGESSVRRSKVMASLFPCLYRRSHPHPVGMRHTCNSFLIGPSDYKKREGFKAGANTIVVSHWSAHAGRRDVA